MILCTYLVSAYAHPGTRYEEPFLLFVPLRLLHKMQTLSAASVVKLTLLHSNTKVYCFAHADKPMQESFRVHAAENILNGMNRWNALFCIHQDEGRPFEFSIAALKPSSSVKSVILMHVMYLIGLRWFLGLMQTRSLLQLLGNGSKACKLWSLKSQKKWNAGHTPFTTPMHHALWRISLFLGKVEYAELLTRTWSQLETHKR